MKKLLALTLVALSLGAQAQTLVRPLQGGTGVANANTKTITLGGPLVTSGAFTTTITSTATTNATLPAGTTTLLYSGGDAGTPSALVGTNITGTAAGLTAGLATDTVTKTGTGSTYATSASPTFTGTVNTAAITASGVSTSTATGGFILNSAASTAAKYIDIESTGGTFYAGVSSSTGTGIMSAGRNYAAGLAGSQGIQFSANNGTTVHMDLTSTALTVTGALAISGAVTLPGLATGSAATVGTLCQTVTTGNITVNTTLACLASSERYKQNMRPLDMGLAQVMALRPIAYELRPEFNTTGLGEMPGLSAEQAATVDKRLVGLNSEGGIEGVRYMQLTAVLVKAIQDQQAQINALTQRLAAVESAPVAANDSFFRLRLGALQ